MSVGGARRVQPVWRRRGCGEACPRLPARVAAAPAAGPGGPWAGRVPVETVPAGVTGRQRVRGHRRESRVLLQGILHRLDELSWRWQRLSIAEYLALFRDPGRLFWMNFLAGVARGLGAAVGFTLLGALVLLALQRAVELNLPYLGSLIADLLRIVRTELDGSRPGPGGAPPTP